MLVFELQLIANGHDKFSLFLAFLLIFDSFSHFCGFLLYSHPRILRASTKNYWCSTLISCSTTVTCAVIVWWWFTCDPPHHAVKMIFFFIAPKQNFFPAFFCRSKTPAKKTEHWKPLMIIFQRSSIGQHFKVKFCNTFVDFQVVKVVIIPSLSALSLWSQSASWCLPLTILRL